MYNDHIRFGNDGHLSEGWTVKQLLQKHTSKPYNPLIAGAFFRIGDIESWGCGIDKIRDACSENGTDFPTFEFESTGLMIEFRGTVPVGSGLVKTGDGTTQETTQEKIIAILLERPESTRNELAERLSLTPNGVKYHLDKMRAAGIIRHTGATKKGRWEVLKK